jgi:hypothetical protein
MGMIAVKLICRRTMGYSNMMLCVVKMSRIRGTYTHLIGRNSSQDEDYGNDSFCRDEAGLLL